jgi:hypothetical protein
MPGAGRIWYGHHLVGLEGDARSALCDTGSDSGEANGGGRCMLGGRVDTADVGSQYTGKGDVLGVDSRDPRSRGIIIFGRSRAWGTARGERLSLSVEYPEKPECPERADRFVLLLDLVEKKSDCLLNAASASATRRRSEASPASSSSGNSIMGNVGVGAETSTEGVCGAECRPGPGTSRRGSFKPTTPACSV